MRSVSIPLSLVLAALSSGAACGPNGEGRVEGERLTVATCDVQGPRVFEPFGMALTFMAAERDGDVALLRFAPRVRLSPPTDQLAVTVVGVSALEETLARDGVAEVPVAAAQTWAAAGVGGAAPESANPTVVRVSLALPDTCPQDSTPRVGREGTARFTSFGTNRDQRIAGRLSFELVDLRSGEAVGEAFEARFDFRVQLGSPYQQFIDPTSQGY